MDDAPFAWMMAVDALYVELDPMTHRAFHKGCYAGEGVVLTDRFEATPNERCHACGRRVWRCGDISLG